MAYIICSSEEALLSKSDKPPQDQPDEDLAIVSFEQRIGVENHSVKLITNNLAQMQIAGQYTWTEGAKPIPSGSILYFNPTRFSIPDDAWEKVMPSVPPSPALDPKSGLNVDRDSTGNNGKILKIEHILALAQNLKLEPETIQAVLDVESSGGGYLQSGRPKILYEAHWFGKFTNDIYNDTHPDISCRTWNEARKYYLGGEDEWKRLEKARLLDADAANKSASWGIAQIMGFNYNLCGYNNVSEFVDDMEISEANQVKAMFKFMEFNHIIDDLRRHDWAGFAYTYNGEGYKQNEYHIKLENAYKKHINAKTFRGNDTTIDHEPPSESIRSVFDPKNPINWSDNNCRVSKYFTVGEVTQKDPRRKPRPGSSEEKNCLALAKALDQVREDWGTPIGVTSWYRPEPINAAVGGVSNSQHIYGAAADIYTMDSDGFSERDHKFENWLDTVAWKGRALGYGIRSGRGFTHVDLRSNSERWNY